MVHRANNLTKSQKNSLAVLNFGLYLGARVGVHPGNL